MKFIFHRISYKNSPPNHYPGIYSIPVTQSLPYLATPIPCYVSPTLPIAYLPDPHPDPYPHQHHTWSTQKQIPTLLRLLKNLSGTDISQPGSQALRRTGSSQGSID